MESWIHLKKPVQALVALTLAFSLSGCTWINWLFKPRPSKSMVQALEKLDAISNTTEKTNQVVNGADQRFAALDAHLESIDNRLAALEQNQTPGPAPMTASGAPSALQTPASPEPLLAPEKPVEIRAAKTMSQGGKAAVNHAVSGVGSAPAQAYASAYAAYEKGQLDAARKAFEAFLKQFPAHDLSDNAQYWLGEIFYDRKQYPQAIAAFDKVVKQFPDKDKAPAALLKAGYSSQEANDKDKAAAYFRRVVTDYPFSDLVGAARSRLAQLQNGAAGGGEVIRSDATP